MNIANIVRALLSQRSVKRHLNEILNADEKNDGVVLNRKVIYILPIGILLCLFSLVLLFDTISRKAIVEVIAASISLFLFMLLTIAGVIYYYNCRIYYGEQTFTVSNFFGKKRTYHYENIENIIQGSQVWEFFLKDGKFRTRIAMSGCYSFLAHAKKKKNFPVSTKRTKDIFNNNVKNPDSFVALFWIVMSMFIIGIFCCAIFGFPKDYSSLQEESIFFENYETTKSFSNDLILYSSKTALPYRIFGYNKKIENIDEFFKKIDQHTEFSIRARLVEKNDYYEIITITSEDNFISIDSAHQFEFHRYIVVLISLVLILFILLTISGIMVCIGRNPNRYSDRIVHLFFKKGTIRTQEAIISVAKNQ